MVHVAHRDAAVMDSHRAAEREYHKQRRIVAAHAPDSTMNRKQAHVRRVSATVASAENSETIRNQAMVPTPVEHSKALYLIEHWEPEGVWSLPRTRTRADRSEAPVATRRDDVA